MTKLTHLGYSKPESEKSSLKPIFDKPIFSTDFCFRDIYNKKWSEDFKKLRNE